MATAFFLCTAGATAGRAQIVRKTPPGQVKTSQPAFGGLSRRLAEDRGRTGSTRRHRPGEALRHRAAADLDRGRQIRFDGFDSIEGVALMSPGGDAMGVGIWRGSC
jgi:hypothetical protein